MRQLGATPLGAHFGGPDFFLSCGPATARPACFPGSDCMDSITMIRFTTNKGVIDIELDHEHAPKTSENFEEYVKSGFYNGVIFHRVIRGFMIQGGGFLPGMIQKETRAPIENEAANGLKNDRYTIAMARTGDPHSATAQFFINVADNDFLNHTAPTSQGWGYAVFGRVVAGEDVVDEIAKVRTSTRGFYGDVPVEDVVIEKAEIVAD